MNASPLSSSGTDFIASRVVASRVPKNDKSTANPKEILNEIQLFYVNLYDKKVDHLDENLINLFSVQLIPVNLPMTNVIRQRNNLL